MSQSLDSLITLLTEKLSSITDTSDNGEELLLISKAVSQINEVKASEANYQSLLERLTQLESLVQTTGENTSALITENDSKINALTLSLNEYKANKNNPNNVTKNQVGLNLVDNFTNTFDVTDSSVDKYALAKGVNSVWNKIESLENYHNSYPTPWEKINTGSPLKFGPKVGSDELVARWLDINTITIYGIIRINQNLVTGDPLITLRDADYYFPYNHLSTLGGSSDNNTVGLYLNVTSDNILYTPHLTHINPNEGGHIYLSTSIPVFKR